MPLPTPLPRRHEFTTPNTSTDEEAEAQLMAYKEANGEPMTVVRIQWT